MIDDDWLDWTGVGVGVGEAMENLRCGGRVVERVCHVVTVAVGITIQTFTAETPNFPEEARSIQRKTRRTTKNTTVGGDYGSSIQAPTLPPV